MPGLFLLMRMPAKSCHDRLSHSGLTYFKEESPTPIHPRKLSFLRNPPHRFEMFSTTRPFNGESWKKSYSCCLSNSKITWSLGTKYVFPGVTDNILEHSSNTPLLLLVYKGTASIEKTFSIKTLSLFKNHTLLFESLNSGGRPPRARAHGYSTNSRVLRPAMATLAAGQRSKTTLLKKKKKIYLAKQYYSKNMKMQHKSYPSFFSATPYLNTFALKR